jgi:hypothetical protein
MTPNTRDGETCPTCWQPVPVPQRGDHDYGIPLRAALNAVPPEPLDGLDVARLARALDNGLQLGQPWTGEASYADFLLACAAAIATEYAALRSDR